MVLRLTTTFIDNQQEKKMSNLQLQNTVIVSFSLSNRNLVPAGIPDKVARVREAMDVRHVSQALDAGRPELLERGRLMDGLVTTGEQVLAEQYVTVAEMEKALLAAGYVLADIHWYEKLPSPCKDKRNFKPKSKFMVNATLSRLPTDYKPILPSIPDELTAPVWGQAYIWQNPDNKSVVTLTARAPHEHPRYSLEVKSGSFIAWPL
jgi:hypothetical protein